MTRLMNISDFSEKINKAVEMRERHFEKAENKLLTNLVDGFLTELKERQKGYLKALEEGDKKENLEENYLRFEAKVEICTNAAFYGFTEKEEQFIEIFLEKAEEYKTRVIEEVYQEIKNAGYKKITVSGAKHTRHFCFYVSLFIDMTKTKQKPAVRSKKEF